VASRQLDGASASFAASMLGGRSKKPFRCLRTIGLLVIAIHSAVTDSMVRQLPAIRSSTLDDCMMSCSEPFSLLSWDATGDAARSSLGWRRKEGSSSSSGLPSTSVAEDCAAMMAMIASIIESCSSVGGFFGTICDLVATWMPSRSAITLLCSFGSLCISTASALLSLHSLPWFPLVQHLSPLDNFLHVPHSFFRMHSEMQHRRWARPHPLIMWKE